jgi:RecJ-like exonuclease
MLVVIGCDTCGNQDNLCIEFKFTAESKSCSECHSINSNTWSFHFCGLPCFFRWAKIVEEKGVPCRDCHSTGYLFGIKVNGTCTTCKGKKFVKKPIPWKVTP